MSDEQHGDVKPLLEIHDLEVTFTSRTSTVHAARGVNIVMYPGQSLAIVGESGSGKSTTAHSIIDLLPAGGHVTGGTIIFDGKTLFDTKLSDADRQRLEELDKIRDQSASSEERDAAETERASIVARGRVVKAPTRDFVALRGQGIGLVPQDPMSNLNPVYRIRAQVKETLKANNIDVKRSTYKGLAKMLEGEEIPDTPDGRLYLSDEGRDGLLSELNLRAVSESELEQLRQAGVGSALVDDINRHGLTPELMKQLLDYDVLPATRENVKTLAQADLSPEKRESVVKQLADAEDLPSAIRNSLKKLMQADLPTQGRKGAANKTPTQADLPRGLREDLQALLAVNLPPALRDALVAKHQFAQSVEDGLVVGFSTRMEVQAHLASTGIPDAADLATRYATGVDTNDRVAGLLAEAGLPDAVRRSRQYPHEFSGGMRQRALIAIGLASRPQLLIADEPTSALDVTVQRQILDHLGVLTRELGTAVLFITHDLGLAAERAEQLVVMYKGHVVESGPSFEILTHPQHPYTKRLVAAAPSLASHRIQAAKDAGQVSTELRSMTSGDGISSERPVALEVRDLTKVFRIRGARPGSGTEFTAVDNVSFVLRKGTTTGLVGESGSGKSTCANMILGLLEPTSGNIIFEGTDMASLNNRQMFAFRRRVQPIFQDPYGSLDPMYSIYRVIEEPLRTHHVGNRREREARVRELLDLVALPASTMRRYPNELSGGQRQRVAVARALALDPEVVVCDEAVSALDVLVQAQILELLEKLQHENGYTYLFITHDLAVVRQIADQVCVMDHGKLVEMGATDEIFDNPQQAYTQALLDAIPGATLDFAAAGAE